jgi:hypothetical protein
LLLFLTIRNLRARSSSGDPTTRLRQGIEPQKDVFAADTSWRRSFVTGDSMPDIQTDLSRPVPSIAPSGLPSLSDDECLIRLAQAVADQDSDHLDEVARLIGRLVVTIE